MFFLSVTRQNPSKYGDLTVFLMILSIASLLFLCINCR